MSYSNYEGDKIEANTEQLVPARKKLAETKIENPPGHGWISKSSRRELPRVFRTGAFRVNSRDELPVLVLVTHLSGRFVAEF